MRSAAVRRCSGSIAAIAKVSVPAVVAIAAIAGVAFVACIVIGFGTGTACTTEYRTALADEPCARIDRAVTVGVLVEVVLAIVAVGGQVAGGRRYARLATFGMLGASIVCVAIVALVSASWSRP